MLAPPNQGARSFDERFPAGHVGGGRSAALRTGAVRRSVDLAVHRQAQPAGGARQRFAHQPVDHFEVAAGAVDFVLAVGTHDRGRQQAAHSVPGATAAAA